jgi:hypothetical protein
MRKKNPSHDMRRCPPPLNWTILSRSQETSSLAGLNLEYGVIVILVAVDDLAPDGSTWQNELTTATAKDGQTVVLLLVHPVLSKHSQKDRAVHLCTILMSVADGGTPAWHSSDDTLDGVRSYSILFTIMSAW